MKPLRVLLVYPQVPETFWSCTHALRFFGKRANNPPLGLLTVAALLPPHFERRLRDLNVEPLQPDDLDWADFVFISAMTIQRESCRRLIDRCRKAGVKVVAGGPLFTNEPEALEHVDHLVLNEAEVTLPQFLNDLEQGTPQPRYASGQWADLPASPAPACDLIDLRAYAALSVQFSRGCPHQCDFCNVTALFGHHPRTKTAAQVITELDRIYALGWRGWVLFVDDNLMCHKPALKNELLPAIIRWKRQHPGLSFHTQISMNVADDPELMDLLYEAGFDWIFVGIETPEECSLEECHKKQNLNRDLPTQIRQLQRAGMQVQVGFIVGFDHDPPDICRRQFEFIQANGIVMAMVGLLQAIPGTKLYERLKQEGRLLETFSGNNTDTTNFVTRLNYQHLQGQYRALMKDLYAPQNYYRRVKSFLTEYKEPKEQPPLTMQAVVALLRCFFWLGLMRNGRTDFWRGFLWTCFRKPESVQNFLTLAVLGYHFRRVHED